MPTACVLVIAIGPAAVPDSSIQETPVISPLPFREKKPAAHGSPGSARPRGWIAVTPVRTLLALDQRGIADLHAGHVGDRVATSPACRGTGCRARARGLPAGVVS